MQKISLSLWLLLFFCFLGCGSGNGGDGGGGTTSTPSKAVTTFKTSLAEGRTETFGTVEFTADMPDGATVKTDNNGMIRSSSLTLTDKALAASTRLISGTYRPPTNGLPAQVHIGIVTLNSTGNVTGMSPGKFATLTSEIKPGASVSAASFGQPESVVMSDPAGTIIPSSTAQITSLTVLE